MQARLAALVFLEIAFPFRLLFFYSFFLFSFLDTPNFKSVGGSVSNDPSKSSE